MVHLLHCCVWILNFYCYFFTDLGLSNQHSPRVQRVQRAQLVPHHPDKRIVTKGQRRFVFFIFYSFSRYNKSTPPEVQVFLLDLANLGCLAFPVDEKQRVNFHFISTHSKFISKELMSH